MYVVERWLSRMSRSPYVEDFILKGGMLLASFGTRRPTVDADALARNMPSDEEAVGRRIAEIATMEDADDGVEFLTDTLATAVIRDDALYSGVRVTMTAQLATAQVKLRLDINFGDPVTPSPRLVELPPLRPGSPPIVILGYPIETVFAEKLVTAIELGRANTRVRDFVDVYLLTDTRPVQCGSLRSALQATADFRGTRLTPFSRATDGIGELRDSTYAAYRKGLGEVGATLPEKFSDAVAAVTDFVDPVLDVLDSTAVWNPVDRVWSSASGTTSDAGGIRA
ncbi:nucleotidyl transferase AbiEii/AbiGii toxin family protein [Herbiconiux moechotypicola]|uniref:Nucleotidyl transferase AbiEii/AbiGii toxin family protein n=1 Tax=Herbiconiux moechotypicola TaxID=637393 RepID=A0ABN3D931_9MICO|nr:nucleotidyl transferase AbiEii/AbiGii toxin family protein [Herbiconiux moechotypicola]MCS5728282.1 nucleotidyl transferase AbiEii/AbiGii toxin family protein [Herbiconiux moechotypicola]